MRGEANSAHMILCSQHGNLVLLAHKCFPGLLSEPWRWWRWLGAGSAPSLLAAAPVVGPQTAGSDGKRAEPALNLEIKNTLGGGKV